MSLYSDAVVYGADTTDIQAGGQGFLANVGDALTKGTAGAVVSGFGSIYNTFASGANALGADVGLLDSYKTLAQLDTDWAQYYKEHQNVIDVAGFIGTSLIPGTIAIKGLNALRAGNASNALGRTLGFARTRQAESLNAALAELATEGGSVFTRINKNKLAAMAWGTADQTLTAAAFETGVALTMKQSPLLADDSWWDIGKSAVVGAAFGGLIGGGIDSIILNKGFRDAVKAVDMRQRDYDYLAVFDKFKLSTGDKAYGIVDSLLNLPTEVLAADKIVPLSFHLAQGTTKRWVNIESVLTNALAGAKNTALLDLETTLRGLAGAGSEDVANAVYLLCRPEAAMINAHTLFVDAGYSRVG